MALTKTNGKVCYIEIPAIDIQRSADFYAKVLGWRIRQSSAGRTAFDDATGDVSGARVLGRPASPEPGLLIYIMVDSVAATVEAVLAHGGEIAQAMGVDAPEVTARFRDPAGNVLGLYEEPRRTTSAEG
jgi:predicted enzyme related to lactoylglutathione lyase